MYIFLPSKVGQMLVFMVGDIIEFLGSL